LLRESIGKRRKPKKSQRARKTPLNETFEKIGKKI
jgi:hypothetical protein